ncbi:MAG: HAMP domain-containing protein [Myxococcales bacterium]|nr:HAMP domain-containing protein [Myxococcales bacterium]
MKSLFVRIFLSFWVAMTLIGAAFAVIYATTVPEWRVERIRSLAADTIRLRGLEALDRLRAGGPAAAEAVLARLEERTRLRAALIVEGRVVGTLPVPVAASLASEAGASGEPRRHITEEANTFAEPLPGGAVVVGTDLRTSRLVKYLSPDTLALRLIVIALVAGVICYILARHLTERLRRLRAGAQRLAAGDLSTRIGPELAGMEDEAAALGRDLDRMTERIEGLLAGQHRLLRDVSHELRSPLARLGVALALARQKAGPEAAGPLDRIEREVERLGQLIGEVLTLTRLEEADRPIDLAPVDLTVIVAAVVADADFEAGGQGRRVTLAVADPCTVRGAEELLRRAIENVLRNAVRFTAEATTVEVRVTAAGDDARVEVRDHGQGVPEAHLAAIFQPFHRVGDSRDRGSGGTGIGLAISARAVALHGGSVAATNASGGGLRVTLTLPRASQPAA